MARKGCFTQASKAQKPTINRNTTLGTFKDLTMKSSNPYGYQTLKSQENEVEIHAVAEVAGVSETGEQSLNQPPAPPVEVFTTTVINVS